MSESREAPSYAIKEVDLDSNPSYEAPSYTWRNNDIKGPGVMEEDESSSMLINLAGNEPLEITSYLAKHLQSCTKYWYNLHLADDYG